MKKVLLGTSALVAAAAMSAPAVAAERIQLDLRGYHVGGIAYTDVDTVADANEINFGSDSEVHFRGSTTLDNGLTISFRTELELEDDSDVDSDADTIDEVYIQVDGGFGRVQFGQNDGVMDQTLITAPLIFSEHGHNDPDLDPFAPYGVGTFAGSGGNDIDTYADFTGDDIKIIYFTPEFSGFQFGVSYTPNPCKNDTGYAGCVYSEFGRNFWEVAATFEHEFQGGFGLALSGGYGQGEQGPVATDEPSEWNVGGQVTFGGFVIGGSYADKQTGGLSTDQQHWDVGASYATGPWAFMLSYGNAEGDMDWGGVEGEEYESFLGGFTYMYGPGMQIGLGVQTLDVSEGNANEDGLSVFIENTLQF